MPRPRSLAIAALASAAPFAYGATGHFYGPAAEALGGTYGLTGSGPRERLMGAFGGKR